ncbi:MAG: FAD-binding protein [Gammaproteobacteria bacterium]|nr:FAD-binding protein [Gammaproteobacteria bacterium]
MPADASAPASTADGTLAIEGPIIVSNEAEAGWSQHCDVLIVGFGAAGAAAAITAKEAGADVLIVDRFNGGGASAKSGGVVYAGGGTRQQRAAGYADTPEQMQRYLLREVGDAVTPDTVRRFCEDSVGLIEWLESIGASFDSDQPPPKTSYPPDGCYLYYSGNEGLDDSAAVAVPAPRGHRMRDAGLSGKALFAVLRRRVEALAIPVQTQCAVQRLIVDRHSGAVVGVEVQRLLPGSAAAVEHARLIRRAEAVHNVLPALADRWRARASLIEREQAQRLRIRARRGVLLSTGGFVFNREMLARHAPKYLANMRLGTTGCDGSGIRLGQSVGGVAARMDRVSAWRFINPPLPWAKGIVVDRHGQRFCNEQAYGARLGVAMCEAREGRAWLILDAGLRRRAIRDALFGGLWAFQSVPALLLMLFSPRARNVAALAQRMSMPPQALEATVAQYNAAAQGGDVFHKSPAMIQPLTEGPFWALDISARNPRFPCPAITLGGLRVDEATGAVLDANGCAIAGLHAAGRAAIGLASNHYISGLSLADCLWSGQRAARALVASAAAQTAAA